MLPARILRRFRPLFLQLSNIGAKSCTVKSCSVQFPAIYTSLDIKRSRFAQTRTYVTDKVSRSTMGVIADQETPVLQFTKVLPEASAPMRGSEKAAGYDLKSAVDIVVPARGKALVDTGLKIALPQGCYGRIAPRSGLAVKNFIDVGAGVVDEDYRGVLKVVLFNHSDTDFQVSKGDRIAQLICERIYYPQLQEVKDLDDTGRGEGGFGSTGTN